MPIFYQMLDWIPCPYMFFFLNRKSECLKSFILAAQGTISKIVSVSPYHILLTLLLEIEFHIQNTLVSWKKKKKTKFK